MCLSVYLIGYFQDTVFYVNSKRQCDVSMKTVLVLKSQNVRDT